MNTIPAPTLVLPREEWPDADFDIPDGELLDPLTAESDRDDDDDVDWDVDMDLGKTGGAKAEAKAVLTEMYARFESNGASNRITIRPALPSQEEQADDDEDDGVSTIKVTALPQHITKPLSTPMDEDLESAFLLPSDLTQLSLAPISLSHKSSKNSLEWGDKDQTSSSSQSSDAYSGLGFADISLSSHSTSSVCSMSETTESDCDGEEDLEGLVIPSGLFKSGHSVKQLKKILEIRKQVQRPDQRIKVASPDSEDDFEIGLIIDDDDDLTPSRLIHSQQSQRLANCSNSKGVLARPPVAIRLPSRGQGNRARSPVKPPPSSMRQFQLINLSPSPPLPFVLPTRTQTYKEVLSNAKSRPLCSPSPGTLRGQKSHSGLKPPTPPSTQRKQLTRKASLSSLMETNTSQACVSTAATGSSTKFARYEAPTVASRAKSHINHSSRIPGLDYIVPPTRPSTPSFNPAALRLTMPTSIRVKSRPSLSAVFAAPSSLSTATISNPSSSYRCVSPHPPRPPSTSSLRVHQLQSHPVASTSTSIPKLLRRPKRPRMYGDGTELDGIYDLPTDREMEGRYRVQPKITCISGASRHPKTCPKDEEKEKGTLRKKGRKELSGGADTPNLLAPTTNMLRRTNRIDFPSKFSGAEITVNNKKDTSPITRQTKRKPTLIRHLGGANGPKVIGEMKWNPATLRWEGNEQTLRGFDVATGTSIRPALITHLTGSSIGSPVGSFVSGARKVGHMIFDPARMSWMSSLPPDQDEADVFADLADYGEDDWEPKGGTIRAGQQTTPSTYSLVDAPSPARSRAHIRTVSQSGSDYGDRGSRASLVCDVDCDFVEKCRVAEERHLTEIKGWRMPTSLDTFELDRSNLFEIRALATRKY